MVKKVLGGRSSVRVAAVQASPVFFNKDKTIDKACGLIRQAAAGGAELIAFPETFVPGYPAYFTCGPATPDCEVRRLRYRASGQRRRGPERGH